MDTPTKTTYTKSPDASENLNFPIKLVTIHSYDEEAIRREFHRHDELQILYMEQGSMYVHLENEQIHLTQGNAFLINQSIEHYFIFEQNNSTARLFLFHPAFLFGFNNAALNAKYLAPIVGNKQNRYHLIDQSEQWRASILEIIKELISVNLAADYGYELVTKELLCRLWLILLKQLAHSDHVTPQLQANVPNSRVRSAILYIEDHYTEAVTLDEIANSIHVSKSECCRSFKKALQMTPFEYLLKYRIYIASVKIASNDPIASSISGLASSVGFNNPSYFNKVFKEFIGCTPTQYRKDLDSYNVLALLPTQKVIEKSPKN